MHTPGRFVWLHRLILGCGLIWLVAAATVIAQGPAFGLQPLAAPPGRISLLAYQPASRALYAVAVAASPRSDAIYRSNDLGATWQPFSNNLLHGAITTLYADRKTRKLYVGLLGTSSPTAARDGLWYSDPDGAGWRQHDLGREGIVVRRVTRNADGTLLLAGATGGEMFPSSYIYSSRDDGETWSEVEALRFDQRPQNALRDLIPHPTDANRLFIATEGGDIYESLDAGVSWNRLALPAEFVAPAAAGPALLAVEAARPQSMMVARNLGTGPGAGIAIARSSDGGKTWRTQASPGLAERAEIFSLASLGNRAWLLSTGVGSYRSEDDGATWQLMEGPLGSGSIAAFLPLDGPPRSLLAAGGYGLFVSRDAGRLWQRFGSGLPANLPFVGLLTDARQPRVVLARVARPPVAGAPLPPAVLRSADGGSTWVAAAQGLPEAQPDAWAQDPADPNTIFLAGDGLAAKSADGGLTWQHMAIPPGPRYAAAVSPTYRNVIYLGGDPMLRSVDAGDTWEEAAVVTGSDTRQPAPVTGLIIDPMDARHLWASLQSGGVYESRDGGDTWRAAGLEGQPVAWMTGHSQIVGDSVKVTIYAGTSDGGIFRRAAGAETWLPADGDLPKECATSAFMADPELPGVLWAGCSGGSIYYSEDDGTTWLNVGAGFGDNVALALAPDPQSPGNILLASESAGLWRLAPNPSVIAAKRQPPSTVDARIEIVWPHGWAPVSEASEANLTLRLLQPASLLPTSCTWSPEVTIWQAVGSDPAEPIGTAVQRNVDGQPYAVWDLNDVDVRRAGDPATTLYFMTRVKGTPTATNVWAHGVDPLTRFPFQEQPSGLALNGIRAADTRIQIVWPHDEAGEARPAAEATLANVTLAVFEHGTRLSAPLAWRPRAITLFGAWDHEIARPLSSEPVRQVRKAGAITYPVWEFNNIDVERAAEGSTLYLWAMVDGVETYPVVWAHGADARTVFPAMDQPIQGCFP